MGTIADSSAIRDEERVLAQHQAALTLLQARLSAPDVHSLSWLDLACGRGQIIASLDENLSPQARSKIKYWAYDLNQAYERETRRTAERLGFAQLRSTVGHLSNFDRILPEDALFDFITLTNAIHEVDPSSLAGVFVTSIRRLKDSGTLFIYDMEQVRPPELGALPWRRDDIRRVVRRMLDSLGATGYHPEVGLWSHRTCNGWNVQLQRQHLNVSRVDASERVATAIDETRDEIVQVLGRRLAECRATLEALTAYGAETAQEQGEKEHLLFEFWALSRALERIA